MVKQTNRYTVLFASMAVQLCTGIIYMWSVFQQFLVEHRGFDSAQVAMIGSLMLAMFVVGIVFGGRIADKIGPKKVVIAGSILFSLGLFLTSFLFDSPPWLLYLSYGVVGGIGVGAAYNSSIACAQKWFPDKRGFATGMVVCAFGFSIVIFAPVARWLLSSLDAPWTFRVFAIVFLAICLLACIFIKNPPEGYLPVGYTPKATAAVANVTTKEMLKTPTFYFIALSMMFLTPAYFILNPIFMILGEAKGLSSDMAMVGVMVTGIASACGRLIAPWVSDRIGRKGAILALCIITLLSMVLMIFTSGILYIVLITLISLAYGGSSGIYPPLTSDLYGTKYAGSNYGCVMVGFGLSAVLFPLLSSTINKAGAQNGDYTLSFIIAAVTCVIAIIVTLLIRTPKKVRE